MGRKRSKLLGCPGNKKVLPDDGNLMMSGGSSNELSGRTWKGEGPPGTTSLSFPGSPSLGWSGMCWRNICTNEEPNDALFSASPLGLPYLAVVLQKNRQLRLSLVQLTDVLDGVG